MMKTLIFVSLLAVSSLAHAGILKDYPRVVQSCDSLASSMLSQGDDLATSAFEACLHGAEDGITGNAKHHAEVVARYDKAFQSPSIPMYQRVAFPRIKMARNVGYSIGKKAVNK